MTYTQTQEVLQLFFRHQPRIKGTILASLPGFAEEENDFQETFLIVQKKAPGGYLGTNFLAWAFRTAPFQVIKAQTSHQRHTRFLSDLEDRLINEMAH